MRNLFAMLVPTVLLCGYGFSQSGNCTAGPATTTDVRDGVTAKMVSFQTHSRKFTAHAFVPDRKEAVPGFAFSHSSIRYPDSQVDLFQFARAIARAGSAIILLDGTIDWQTRLNDTTIRARDVACAAHWLMANVKLDPNNLSIGGPIKFLHDHVEPFCPDSDKQPCWEAWFYFYWGSDHEENCTKMMKMPEGQLWMIHNTPPEFGLKDVRLEWLVEAPGVVAKR